MRIGVVTFPGSLDDLDDAAPCGPSAGAAPVDLWHAGTTIWVSLTPS